MQVTNSSRQVSTSDHPLFRQTLQYSNGYVTVGLVYATLLLAASLDVLGWIHIGPSYSGFSRLDRAARERGGDSSKRRSSALALMTAGVTGFLIARMVQRHCRRDGANRGMVRVVWHDLLKYTHMGRAIMAAMTAVLTWRGLESLSDHRPAEGGVGRVSVVLVGAATLSMVTAATFHHLHFRIKARYVELARIKRAASKRSS